MASWVQESRAARCVECDSALAHDQRYCVECGARRGPLPPVARHRIDTLRPPAPVQAGLPAVAPAPASVPAGARDSGSPGWARVLWPAGSIMPRPQAVAVAVLAFLAFGVVVGSAVRPSEVNSSPLLVADVPAPASTQPATSTPPPAEAATTPEVSTAAVTPKPAAIAKPKPSTTTSKTTTPGAGPAPSGLPAVKHVFEIVLSEHGFNEAFGPSSTATYLAKTLPSQGELLSNYYAAAGGALANEIALISGQGPTAQTVANCPTFADITPGTIGAEGQVTGTGCVYPASTLTLAGELTAAGKTWKGYVQGVGSGAPGEPATCRHPALGSADPDQLATPTDPYVTWRNPFVYFHSLIDGAACAKQDVGLEQLAPDLKTAAGTPSLAYIVPDRCDDGGEQPCAPGAPAGLAAAEGFLKSVVPEIERSPAYKQGGLIAITFDEAPQSGPGADPSSCCETPAYPNLAGSPVAGTTATTTTDTTGTAVTTVSTTTTAATQPSGGETSPMGGGGRVGLLLISPYVKAGSVNESFFNHFSLLLSIEELFKVKRLGYTSNPAMPSFEKPIYNAPAAKG